MNTTRSRSIRGRCRMSISRRAATRTTSARAPASRGTSARTAGSVVRGGYGLVYTNITNATQGTEITALKQNSIIINNPSYPDPYQGRDPASFASTAPPNINILSNDLVNAPVNTYTAGFSQQLMADTAINVDGVYQNATDYLTTENINTPRNGVRPLPEWGQIISTDPIGEWTYKALLVRLEKRLSHRYQYQVSYTLAKQDGNYGTPMLVGINQGGGITDYYNPAVRPRSAERRPPARARRERRVPAAVERRHRHDLQLPDDDAVQRARRRRPQWRRRSTPTTSPARRRAWATGTTRR